MRALYATVEQVMRAADIKVTAYLKDEILRSLESSCDAVDKLIVVGDTQRPAFAPWAGEISFDWPTVNNGNAYRFWLDQFRLHSLDSIVSGGVDVESAALPWPASGPPYSAIDIDTSGALSLEIGDTGTGQRSLTLGGIWGIVGDDRSRSSWTLGASVSDSATDLVINAPIGIGSIVLIGSERVIVEDRSWSASGQTASALAVQMNAQSVTVADGTDFIIGEEIIVDSERMLIRDIVGNVLIVQRAADGTVLADHANGTAIYWSRSCAVERGALGTTAASHSDGTMISIYSAPAIASQLAIAYTIDRRAQEDVGYARDLSHIRDVRGLSAKKVGGDVGGQGIPALEDRLISAYGRIRHSAI